MSCCFKYSTRCSMNTSPPGISMARWACMQCASEMHCTSQCLMFEAPRTWSCIACRCLLGMAAAMQNHAQTVCTIWNSKDVRERWVKYAVSFDVRQGC